MGEASITSCWPRCTMSHLLMLNGHNAGHNVARRPDRSAGTHKYTLSSVAVQQCQPQCVHGTYPLHTAAADVAEWPVGAL